MMIYVKRAILLLVMCCGFSVCAQSSGLPADKNTFHIYLLMGQSNMAGRDTRELDQQVDNSRVLSLNASNQWVVARDPIHKKIRRTEPGAGPGIPFALEMIKSDPDIIIGLVPCAVGGSPLKRWVKGGDLYEEALSRARLAAQSGVISGVLWHQGETDSDKEPYANRYEACLGKMIEDLRADLGNPDLPVVVGQLGAFLDPEKHPYVETVREAIRNVSKKVPNVGYADSVGLDHKGDHLHFNAAGSTLLGQRLAEAMKNLQK